MEPQHRRRRVARPLTSILAVAGLILFGAIAPAHADEPPPLDWQPVSSATTPEGVTATWERADSQFSAFESGVEFKDSAPVYRPNVINETGEAIYVGFGTDLVTQGQINRLWVPQEWGPFEEFFADGLGEMFVQKIEPGESLVDTNIPWVYGMPAWSGHTIELYQLDAPPDLGTPPGATALASITTPGRFVGANFDDAVDLSNLSAAMGKRLTISSGGSTPEIFAGVATSVRASGLTPGETLEFWAMPNNNYAFFQILGGSLLTDAVSLGTATVAADGTLLGYVVVPETMRPMPGDESVPYQLVAGVRAERYWPAGTWDDFVVKDPPNSTTANTAGGSGSVTVGATTLALSFGGSAAPAEVSVTASATGPEPSGFALTSEPPIYYHLSASEEFDGTATVCISHELTDPLPHLFHFDTGDEPKWVDITTTSGPGQVCGETTSFSPFTLGYPEKSGFEFSGFLDPVSADGVNVAKAGQAVPVKFSLNGDQGLEIIASAQFVASGTVTNPSGEVLDTVTAGKSGLQYDPASDIYTYVWKTAKSMAKQTGRFVLTLSDGSQYSFDVAFKK